MGACFSSASAAPAGAAERRPSKEDNKKRRGGASPEGATKAAATAPAAAPVRVEFGYERDFEARYEVGRLLGHGQFGYTFAATDRQSGDRVAVKRIDKAKMTRPVAVEDVKREVKILKALKGHENIVHFYNAFEDDSYVYIVMELCEGGELLDRILAKKNSRYSEKDAAVVVRQMLKVAAECHLRGLVHRDMKPENFLFKSNKEDSPLKATDFGLSDFIKPGKKFHDIVGSAYYVAPEVLKRRSGPESDVWSIGVITYILLCGRRPFWDKTEDGIFKEVLRNKPDFRRVPPSRKYPQTFVPLPPPPPPAARSPAMDDDGAASPSPSLSPSPSRSPSPLPVADPVTVAAAPPGHVAVAIPLRKPSPSSGGGGGGREDAWSDGATSTLIDAWGERFVALGRGSLRHPQWQEVAEVVSSRDGYSKAPKSDVQCKNRIDTLKKKYKIEKAKRGSSWPYFDRLDDLLAAVHKPNSSSSSAAAAARSAPPMVPPRINFPQRTRTPLQPSAGFKRRMPSPPPQASASSESSDGFPPETRSALPNGKRQRVEEQTPAAAANGGESSNSRAQGLRDLALAIRRLGEVYERVENAKREQEQRMERERLEAARELEDQRAQFFLKMQMELTKATGGSASAAAAPMAVPIPADGNGTRRTGMAAEVATSSNHRVRYRIKGSSHHHPAQQPAQQPHYQNNAKGNGSDSDNKEAQEDAEDEEEESQ